MGGPDVVVAWFVAGLGLVLLELHHRAFFALFAALGCFGAGVVAVFAPGAVWAEALTGLAIAGVGVFAVRPMVSGAVESRRTVTGVGRGVHGELVGERAVTLDLVADADQVGHVRLAGERWLAVSGGTAPIPADTTVTVTGVVGTTLVVWPVAGPGPIAPMSRGSE